jgi:hypothetical protein
VDKERQEFLGMVSTEVDARLSFDKERQVDKERKQDMKREGQYREKQIVGKKQRQVR